MRPGSRPSATASPSASPPAEASDPKRWIALIVLIVSNFMTVADIFITNIGIATIKSDLQATLGQIQFVVATYQLSYAVGLISGGRLGDIFGRKRMFMLGLAGFTLASALCGLAQSPGMLIAARLLQGLTAAVMIPQVLATIQGIFPPQERPTVFAIYGAALGMAGVVGLMLGGVLIRLNVFGLGWRPIFLINVPFGIAALIGAILNVRESKAAQATKLDLGGFLLMSLGLFLLTFPLLEGRDLGWPVWTFPCLLSSIPVLALFALFERRMASRGGAPLIPLRLFQDKAFVLGLSIVLCFYTEMISYLMVLALYLQMGLQLKPLPASLSFAPVALGFLFGAIASAKAVKKVGGKRVLFMGATIGAISTAAMTGMMAFPDLPGMAFWLMPVFLINGFGQGWVYAPLLNTLLTTIRPSDAGAAAGVLTTVQQVAGAIGVALAGIIFFGQINGHATPVAQELSSPLQAQIQALHVRHAIADRVVAAFQDQFVRLEASKDPGGASTPLSIAPMLHGQAPAAALEPILDEALTTAKRHNFSFAFQLTLVFYLVTWCLIVALVSRIRSLAPAEQAAPKPPEQPRQQVEERTVPMASKLEELPADDRPELDPFEPDPIPDPLPEPAVLVVADEEAGEPIEEERSPVELEGLLFCICGSQLVLEPSLQSRFVCPQSIASQGRTCQMPGLSLQTLDRAIAQLLKRGVKTRLDEQRSEADVQAASLKKELAWLQGKWERILENYEDGLYGDAPKAKALRDEKIAGIEQRRSGIANEVAKRYSGIRELMSDLEACETRWADLSGDAKRNLVTKHVPLGFSVRRDLGLQAVVEGRPLTVRPQTRMLASREPNGKVRATSELSSHVLD